MNTIRLRLADPEDAERLYSLEFPEQLEMKTLAVEGVTDIESVRVATNTKLRDDDHVYVKCHKRGKKGNILRSTWTFFHGRLVSLVIDNVSVTIRTTGGEIVLYR